jgi:hypothetical protein
MNEDTQTNLLLENVFGSTVICATHPSVKLFIPFKSFSTSHRTTCSDIFIIRGLKLLFDGNLCASVP